MWKREAVRGEPGLQRRLRHAAHVAGLAVPFQPVHQDDIAARLRRPLLVHPHLRSRFGLVEARPHRIPRGVQPPRPEMPRHGLRVRAPE
jgi:hypothetical protein